MTLVLCSPAIRPSHRAAQDRRPVSPATARPGRAPDRPVLETFQQFKRTRNLRYGLQEAQLRQFVRSLSGMTLAEARRLVARCLLDDDALSVDDLARAWAAAKRRELEESQRSRAHRFRSGQSASLGGLWRLKERPRRFRAGFSDRARELGLHPPRGVLLVGGPGLRQEPRCQARWRAPMGLPLVRLDPVAPVRQVHRRVGEEPAQGPGDGGGPVAPRPVDRRDREGLRLGRLLRVRRRARPAPVRLLPHLAAGRQRAVFVAATANDLSSTPPELLRKGRFDEVFFVDLPSPQARQRDSTSACASQAGSRGLRSRALTRASEGFSEARSSRWSCRPSTACWPRPARGSRTNGSWRKCSAQSPFPVHAARRSPP